MAWRRIGLALMPAVMAQLAMAQPVPAESQPVPAESQPVPADAAWAAAAVAVAEGVVIPRHDAHARATDALARAVARLCDGAEPARVGPALASARQALEAALVTFGAVRPVAYGPTVEGFGVARLRFWPDPRATGERQLRRVLAAPPAAGWTAAAVSAASVATTDLATLERLLLQPARPAAPACAYARAVATHQALLAADLAAAWRGPMLQTIARPGPDNALYRTGQEAARDVYKTLAGGLEEILTRRLDPLLGQQAADADPRAAEARRTGQSAALMAQGLETLAAILTVPGGFGDLAAARGTGPLAAGMARELQAVAQGLRALPAPLERHVAEAAGWAEVDALRARLLAVLGLMRSTLGPSLDLTQGFNASDGD